MQIVIDIDENVFTRLFDNGTEDCEIVNDDLFAVAKSIRNGTPLPENPTNGDMIKALFPSVVNSTMDLVEVFNINRAKKWWNTLYKEESEVEK